MRRGTKRGSKRMRLTAALLCAGVLAAGTYAFTASNTVPATRAGDGSGTISGYTISNVEYTTQTSDPSILNTYSFTLDAAARVVHAKTVSGVTTYDTCTAGAGNSWTCTAASGTTVLSMDSLRVIAYQ
jgi:hypothetical protein